MTTFGRKIIMSVKQINFFEWLLLLFLSYFILLLVSYVYAYSTDNGGIEFGFLFHVQYAERFKNIYSNPEKYPYFFFLYPPLYPYMQMLLLKFLKVDVFTELHKALVVGRSISLVLFFVDVYIITVIIRLYNRAQKHLYTALLLLMLLPAHFFTFRPDSIKTTLFLAALYFFLRYDFKLHEKKYLIIGCAAAYTGTFFKHDVAIYVALYFVLFTILFRSKQHLIILTVFTVLIIAGFLMIELIPGTYVFDNLFHYNLQYTTDITLNLLGISFNLLRLLPLLVIAAINAPKEDTFARFTGILGILYTVFSSVAMLRAGADLNYTYESVTLLVINFGICIPNINTLKSKVAFSVLLCYLLLYNHHLTDSSIFKNETKKEQLLAYNRKLQVGIEVHKITGNDVLFLTNGSMMIFHSKCNLMHGYDFHMERFTQLYLHRDIKSKIIQSASVAQYDSLYTNGFVKYILVENVPDAIGQVGKFYKNYYIYRQIDNYLLYKSRL